MGMDGVAADGWVSGAQCTHRQFGQDVPVIDVTGVRQVSARAARMLGKVFK